MSQKKKRYFVVGEVTISVGVRVVARSEVEARKIAGMASMQSLCNQCARGEDDVWSTSDLDGEPTITGVELEGADLEDG